MSRPFKTSFQAKATVVITVTCSGGHTHIFNENNLEVQGGCRTKHPEGSYCYCDSERIVVEFVCDQCPLVLDKYSKKMVPAVQRVELT